MAPQSCYRTRQLQKEGSKECANVISYNHPVSKTNNSQPNSVTQHCQEFPNKMSGTVKKKLHCRRRDSSGHEFNATNIGIDGTSDKKISPCTMSGDHQKDSFPSQVADGLNKVECRSPSPSLLLDKLDDIRNSGNEACCISATDENEESQQVSSDSKHRRSPCALHCEGESKDQSESLSKNHGRVQDISENPCIIDGISAQQSLLQIHQSKDEQFDASIREMKNNTLEENGKVLESFAVNDLKITHKIVPDVPMSKGSDKIAFDGSIQQANNVEINTNILMDLNKTPAVKRQEDAEEKMDMDTKNIESDNTATQLRLDNKSVIECSMAPNVPAFPKVPQAEMGGGGVVRSTQRPRKPCKKNEVEGMPAKPRAEGGDRPRRRPGKLPAKIDPQPEVLLRRGVGGGVVKLKRPPGRPRKAGVRHILHLGQYYGPSQLPLHLITPPCLVSLGHRIDDPQFLAKLEECSNKNAIQPCSAKCKTGGSGWTDLHLSAKQLFCVADSSVAKKRTYQRRKSHKRVVLSRTEDTEKASRNNGSFYTSNKSVLLQSKGLVKKSRLKKGIRQKYSKFISSEHAWKAGLANHFAVHPSKATGSATSNPLRVFNSLTASSLKTPDVTVSNSLKTPSCTGANSPEAPGFTGSNPPMPLNFTGANPLKTPGFTGPNPSKAPGSASSNSPKVPGSASSNSPKVPGYAASNPPKTPNCASSRDAPGFIHLAPPKAPKEVQSRLAQLLSAPGSMTRRAVVELQPLQSPAGLRVSSMARHPRPPHTDFFLPRPGGLQASSGGLHPRPRTPHSSALHPRTRAPHPGAGIPPLGSSIPSSGSVIPTSGSTIPSSGAVIPTSGSTIPSSGTRIPTSGSTIPSSGTRIPTSGSTIPSSGAVIPTSGSTIPSSGAVIPTSGSNIPSSGTRIPTSRSANPSPGTRDVDAKDATANVSLVCSSPVKSVIDDANTIIPKRKRCKISIIPRKKPLGSGSQDTSHDVQAAVPLAIGSAGRNTSKATHLKSKPSVPSSLALNPEHSEGRPGSESPELDVAVAASSPSVSGKMSCDLCDFKLCSASSLKKHMRRHTKAGLMQCPLCPYQTLHMYSMRLHAAEKHGLGNRFECEYCNFKTARKERMRKHLQSHVQKGVAPSSLMDTFHVTCQYKNLDARNAFWKEKLASADCGTNEDELKKLDAKELEFVKFMSLVFETSGQRVLNPVLVNHLDEMLPPLQVSPTCKTSRKRVLKPGRVKQLDKKLPPLQVSPISETSEQQGLNPELVNQPDEMRLSVQVDRKVDHKIDYENAPDESSWFSYSPLIEVTTAELALPPKHRCCSCNFTSVDLGTMTVHRTLHFGFKRFMCFFCEASSLNPAEVLDHDKHSGQLTESCQLSCRVKLQPSSQCRSEDTPLNQHHSQSLDLHSQSNVVALVSLVEETVSKTSVLAEDTQNTVSKISASVEDNLNTVGKISASVEDTQNTVSKISASVEDTQNSVSKISASVEDTQNTVSKTCECVTHNYLENFSSVEVVESQLNWSSMLHANVVLQVAGEGENVWVSERS